MAQLQAEIDTLLADNSTQDISALDVRTVTTDFADTIFRLPALKLEDGSGRLVLEGGEGYLLLEDS